MAKRFKPWAALFLLPLAVNLLLFYLLYRPQQTRLQTWQAAHGLMESRPRLEGLLKESHQIQTGWQSTRFEKGNPSVPIEAIQRLAGRHHLQVIGIETRGRSGKANAGQGAAPALRPAHAVPGFSTMSMELKLGGSFSKLARWMGEVESQYGFQIDSWTVTSPAGPGQPAQMSVQITAFLQGA